MTRIALARIALVALPVAGAVLAALTHGSPSLHCEPSCGCGPSGTYSYTRSSRWCAQPMPAPATRPDEGPALAPTAAGTTGPLDR